MTTINNDQSLIEKVGGIEKAREIVEGAPEGASHSNQDSYFKENDYGVWSIWVGYWNSAFRWPESEMLFLDDLRTAIAKHDSQAFKIGDHIRYMGIDRKTPHPEIFKVVGFDSMPGGGDGYKIKNCLGQIDFCYGDNYVLVDCDATDHVTDIRNHVSPSTRVVDL